MKSKRLRPCVCTIGRVTQSEQFTNGPIVETVIQEGNRREALFHEWFSVDNGVCGLVEFEDGSVSLVDAESIKFTDRVKVNVLLDGETLKNAVLSDFFKNDGL